MQNNMQKETQAKSKSGQNRADRISPIPKLLLFDYDGVLIDSLPHVFAVYKEIGRELGIKEFMNITSGDFFELHWHKTFQKVGKGHPEILAKSHEIYMREMQARKTKIGPIPGIKDVIATLKQRNYQLGIVSNNHKELIEDRLGNHGLLSYFDVIVDASAPALKPDPIQLRMAMQELGADTNSTLFIGDMDDDVVAARAADVRFIGVTWGYHSPHRIKGADFIINKPEELLVLLGLRD